MTTTTMSALDRVVAALEAHGCHPKQRGNGYEAKCPSHDDKTPSLSINQGSDGALVKCHAECRTEDVVAEIGLKMSDLFNDSKVATKPPKRIVAEYPYVDEEGALLFTVVRFDPKGFAQRAADGSWKLNGTRRVPYRLPEVLQAVKNGEDIFIAEGEKDADAIVREGVTATTAPQGAGKWRPEFAKHLQGAKRVFVVADKDVPGYRHARDVCLSLVGVAESVEVVEAGFGKDAADHLGGGLPIEDLKVVDPDRLDSLCEDPSADKSTMLDRMISTTTNAIRTVVSALHSLRIDFSSDGPFWTADHKEEDWLIPDLLARGRGHALYAEAKAGKSYVALNAIAAAAIPGHTAWTNLPAGERITVVYLDYEMTKADLKERLEEFGYGPTDDYSRFIYVGAMSFGSDLDSSEGGEALVAFAKECGADLVAVDTMSRAVRGDENLTDTVRAFFKYTGGPLKDAGIATLRLDHAGKDKEKGQRGASGKNDDVDVVWRLDRKLEGTELTCTHKRISWVTDKVVIRRSEDEDGVVTLRRSDDAGLYPAGVKDKAAEMDGAGVPLDCSTRKVREYGVKGYDSLLRATLRYRREVDERSFSETIQSR